MRKFLLLLTAALTISSVLYAQSINGRFSSSIYTFERFDTVNSSTTHARTFQLLNLNVGKDNVWLRSYMNLEADLSENLENDPRLRFYNFYVDIKDLWKGLFFKIGRQPLYNSIAGGVFDGGTVGIKNSDYKVLFYYGGNVPAYQKFELIEDFGDNYTLGGEFTVYALQDWRFSAKYVNKNFKSQPYEAIRLDPTVLNRDTVLIENKSNQYQFLSGEISYNLEKVIDVNARYDYDLNYMKSSKIELLGRYSRIKNLGIDFYFNYREPRVRYNSIFSVFDYGNTWEVEGGLDYTLADRYTLIGKVANVTFKDESSQRVTLGISSPWGSLTGRKNFGFTGEMDAVSLYSAYSFFEGFLTPSLGLSFTHYKLSADDPYNELLSLLGGFNVRPLRQLSFDLQGQYLDNKIYKNDWRLFFKVNFWFNEIFN